MPISNDAKLFKQAAGRRFKNANKLLNAQFWQSRNNPDEFITTLGTPYANQKYHLDAVWYPFYHAAKVLMDVARLARGLMLWLEAFANNQQDAQKDIEDGLILQSYNIGLDLLHCMVSTLSLLTRTLATLIHGGYVARVVENGVRGDTQGVYGFFVGIGANIAGRTAEFVVSKGVEQEISDRTFNLS